MVKRIPLPTGRISLRSLGRSPLRPDGAGAGLAADKIAFLVRDAIERVEQVDGDTSLTPSGKTERRRAIAAEALAKLQRPAFGDLVQRAAQIGAAAGNKRLGALRIADRDTIAADRHRATLAARLVVEAQDDDVLSDFRAAVTAGDPEAVSAARLLPTFGRFASLRAMADDIGTTLALGSEQVRQIERDEAAADVVTWFAGAAQAELAALASSGNLRPETGIDMFMEADVLVPTNQRLAELELQPTPEPRQQ